MKLLKYLFLITFFIGVATSCDYYEDTYDDLNEADNVHVNQEPLQITLTEDDYGEISALGQQRATNLTDSARAVKLDEMGFFTDSVAAPDLVPFLLNDRYPEYGPSSDGSVAKITFDYNGQMPENLRKYTEATQYSLTDSDYDSLTYELGLTKYFFPNQSAKLYIPNVLANVIEQPRVNELVIVSYMKSDVNPNIDTTDSISITGGDPYQETMIYKYYDDNDDGENSWALDDKSYYLNESDYDAMGAPGEYDNFEGEQPQNYLPEFLDHKYPLADGSVSKTMVYEYFTGDDVIMLASTYTKENGSWTGSYNYIQEKTQQFVVKDTRGNWIFDPNVSFRMVSEDYQIIVDAVAEEYGNQYIDDYGTGEYYTGANSYYENFDLRISQRVEYDPENFEGLSNEEAKNKIIQRLPLAMQLLLENKYPDAVPEQNGIPVHYHVTFESYNNDFSRSTWKADMLCTSAGDPPQFELVDNTFTRATGDQEPVDVVVPSGD